MDFDNYTQPLESVIRQECIRRPWPLKAADRMYLFEQWMRLNPSAIREIEYAAISIDKRGMRVSTKYLIERQRYEGRSRLVPVVFVDQFGTKHSWSINNNFTPLLARWLLKRHPDMRIETRKSHFDNEGDMNDNGKR